MNLAALQATAEWVLDCVCSALEEAPCGCPEWAAVVPASPSWDVCCQGMLYVTVNSVFPSGDEFPLQASGPVRCGSGLTATFTVGILRCAPTMNDRGDPPSCQDQAESAAQVHADAMAVVQGLLCCFHEVRNQAQASVASQRFVGPAGGCVGSETVVSVELADLIPLG